MNASKHELRQTDEGRQLLIDGVKIDWFRAGRGRPLLLLNSIEGFDRTLPYMNLLTSHFDVIAPQHPGFANSELPREFRTMEDLANFYLTLLEALDLRNAILVGASFGGWLAAEIAVRAPWRFGCLVMIDPLGIKVGPRDARDITDIFSIPQVQADRLLCWDQASVNGSMANAPAERVAALVRSHQALGQFGWKPYMHNPSLRRWLRRLTMPALFLWGEEDIVIQKDYVQAYAAELPNSRVQTIQGAGHYPHIDKPDDVVGHLLEHCRASFAANAELA